MVIFIFCITHIHFFSFTLWLHKSVNYFLSCEALFSLEMYHTILVFTMFVGSMSPICGSTS